MTWRCALTILVLLPTVAMAADGSTSQPAAGYKLRGPYWSAGVGFIFWQEFLRIKRGATSYSDMQSQLKGINFHGDWNRTIQNSYWQQLYGLEFAYGVLKGQGDQPNVPDRLDNQSWMMATLKLGLIYRTSPVSRFGILVPTHYRKIQWNFNPGSGLMAEDKPLSVGIGFLYTQRFTKDSSMNISMVHQRMWSTVTWSAGYNYDF